MPVAPRPIAKFFTSTDRHRRRRRYCACYRTRAINHSHYCPSVQVAALWLPPSSPTQRCPNRRLQWAQKALSACASQRVCRPLEGWPVSFATDIITAASRVTASRAMTSCAMTSCVYYRFLYCRFLCYFAHDDNILDATCTTLTMAHIDSLTKTLRSSSSDSRPGSRFSRHAPSFPHSSCSALSSYRWAYGSTLSPCL